MKDAWRRRLFIAAAVAVLLLSGSAEAQTTSAGDDCVKTSATADQVIAACSAEIGAGPFAGYDLAIAFYNRSLAYASKGERQRAARDYDQAMRLEPEDSPAFDKRGRPAGFAMRTPPAAATPAPPARTDDPLAKASLTAAVLKHLEGTLEYSRLAAYDERRRSDPAWAASEQGRMVRAWLDGLRADAAATDIVTTDQGRKALQYSVGGQKILDTGILIADLRTDPDYRDFIMNAIAANIATDDKVKAFVATLETDKPASR